MLSWLQAHLKVNDLFVDLGDGKMLMKLLEIISGETVGKPNKGVLRVQKMENVNRCLKFLASKVRATAFIGDSIELLGSCNFLIVISSSLVH